jgi:hypothetical protein
MPGNRVFSTAAFAKPGDARDRALDSRDAGHRRKMAKPQSLKGWQTQTSDLASNVSESVGAASIPVLGKVGERPNAAGI